jgi:hypothetical protein
MVRRPPSAWPPSIIKFTYIEIWTKTCFFGSDPMDHRPCPEPYLVMADNIYMRLSRAFSAGRKLLNLASTDSPGRFMISNFEFRISNNAWYLGVNFSRVHGRIS